ncbi:unnamed protein product [Porites lobata]|uniref:Phospholipase A2-like domain-containing protein n=1 Tax=Porites lobata TaxID=104759 RepID=A0ABN8RJA5_9CNID|nr:unnamed protein product [Porites lobata]
MVSTTVDNAPAFLQLRDKYKQELVEDTRLTKAADLAAKQHVLLTSDAPDAWKRPQLKAVSRQLRHWTKKVRQPFGAAAGGVSAAGATTPGDDDFEAGPMQAWFTQLVKATQGIKQGTPTRGPRKPPIPPKPRFTPSAKKKLNNRSSAGFAKKPRVLPKRKPLVGPRKPWIGKRGKPPSMGRTRRRRAAPSRSRARRRRRSQRGGKLFDVQNLLNKTGIEFHWPGYQYMGPGTHLKKRLARGDPGINRLDRIAKAHDIDYDKAKNLKDKWAADRKMIAKIDQLPGSKNLTERIVRRIMKAKLRLGM